MEEYPKALDKMLKAWNAEPGEVRAILQDALDEEVVFVDPNHQLKGIESFEKMIDEVNGRLGNPVYSRRGRVDFHNNVCRYHWAVHVDGKLLLPGFDVTILNQEGKIKAVYGFFGQLEDKV